MLQTPITLCSRETIYFMTISRYQINKFQNNIIPIYKLARLNMKTGQKVSSTYIL